ncbi:MAG: hypothetical protein V1708_01835 [Candidatus Micrarchaeota archaeon]
MPAKEKQAKRVSSASNVIIAVMLVAGAAVLAYYAFLAPQQPKVLEQTPLFRPNATALRQAEVARLESKYFIKTIEYFDQNDSFSIRYPIGYSAQLDPTLDIRLRFSAYYAPYSSEIFDVRVIDADQLNAQKIIDSAVSANTTADSFLQDGKDLFIVNLALANPVDANDTVFVKQAYYHCPDYWLVYVAGISAPLAPDLELADYMVSTMRCG